MITAHPCDCKRRRYTRQSITSTHAADLASRAARAGGDGVADLDLDLDLACRVAVGGGR
ncbi:MAG TPA: hypothetical protein VFW33_13275 [Gemmataceae bacterium]|nr:hypothetical protein [Gemmataceae bacterium]